jgi:hypothetical protein
MTSKVSDLIAFIAASSNAFSPESWAYRKQARRGIVALAALIPWGESISARVSGRLKDEVSTAFHTTFALVGSGSAVMKAAKL